MKTKISVIGISGKMGKSIVDQILHTDKFLLSGGTANKSIGYDIGKYHGFDPIGIFIEKDLEKAILDADVIIDFSSPCALENLLDVCSKLKKPIIFYYRTLKIYLKTT